jgi:ribosomal protein L40E
MKKPNCLVQARAMAGRAVRWICGTCGALNPDITRDCIRCGQG